MKINFGACFEAKAFINFDSAVVIMPYMQKRNAVVLFNIVDMIKQ